MKGFLPKIATLFFAVLVLVSSSFISIDSHFCNGTKVDSTFFGKADVCNMDMVSCNKEITSNTIITCNCCYNTRMSKFPQALKHNDVISLNLEQIDNTLIVYYVPVFNLIKKQEIDKNYFKNYSSPLVTRDILILVQCFQI